MFDGVKVLSVSTARQTLLGMSMDLFKQSPQ